jgi:hypothetical protein
MKLKIEGYTFIVKDHWREPLDPDGKPFPNEHPEYQKAWRTWVDSWENEETVFVDPGMS